MRLIGVDTPETVKPGTPVQCFGPRASRFDHRLLEGRRVRLVFGVERRDVYGRLLAYVYLGRRFVNAELRPPRARADARRSRRTTASQRAFQRLELQRLRGPGAGLWGACSTRERSVSSARSFATVPAAPRGHPL